MLTTADRCHNTSTVNARRSRVARIHAKDVEHIFEIQTMCLNGNLQQYKIMSEDTLLNNIFISGNNNGKEFMH